MSPQNMQMSAQHSVFFDLKKLHIMLNPYYKANEKVGGFLAA